MKSWWWRQTSQDALSRTAKIHRLSLVAYATRKRREIGVRIDIDLDTVVIDLASENSSPVFEKAPRPAVAREAHGLAENRPPEKDGIAAPAFGNWHDRTRLRRSLLECLYQSIDRLCFDAWHIGKKNDGTAAVLGESRQSERQRAR